MEGEPARWRKVSDAVAGFLRADGKLAPIYASVTENISEHSITDEERLIEYEEYGITYDESSQSYLYQDSLIKNLRDGDFLYTNAAGSIKLIIQRDDNGHIQSIDVE